MRSLRRLIGVAALAAAPVAGLSLLAAPTAAAHDQLVGSTPEDGSTVSTPLTSVELVFSNAIPGEFVQVAVTDAAGTGYVDGDPQTVGDTVTQAVTQLPDGAYTIAYRVVSSDGHPIEGSIAFTVAGVGPAEPQAPPSTPSEPETEPPSTPSSDESPSASAESPTDDTTPAAGSDSSDDGGLGSTATVLLIAGGAVVIALLAFLAAGGRRRGAAEDTDS